MRIGNSLRRIGIFSTTLGLGTAMLSACASTQTATVPAALPAAPTSVSSTLNASTVKVVAATYDENGGRSPVSFKTAPLSLCTLQAKDTHMVTASDQDGLVAFEIAIPHARGPRSAEFLCTKDGHSALVHLNFVPGHVRPRHASAVAVPTKEQMDAFARQNGFDPHTAPNSVLIAHNLPPRAPDFARDPSRHLGWLKAAYSPTTRVITKGVEIPGVRTGKLSGLRSVTPDNSPAKAVEMSSKNWSGYSTTGVAGTWSTVVGDWVNPITCNCSYNPSHAGVWVGLDGAPQHADGSGGDGNIFQGGLSIEFNVSGGVQYYNYSAVWEEGFTMDATQLYTTYYNDEMYTTIYKDIVGNQVYVDYYIKDVTSGTLSTFVVGGGSLKGDTAEWITEAPTINGSEAKLLDYAYLTMSEAQAVSGGTTFDFNQIPTKTAYTLFQITMSMNYPNVDADAIWASGQGNGYIKFNWDACC